jgi:hypothetical protein
MSEHSKLEDGQVEVEVCSGVKPDGTLPKLDFCLACSAVMPYRANKKTCSPACRKALYRTGEAYKVGLRNKVTRRLARKAKHQQRRRIFTPAVAGQKQTGLIREGSETQMCTGRTGGQGGVPQEMPEKLPTMEEAVQTLELMGWGYKVEEQVLKQTPAEEEE